jgi:hypothetical protein
MEFKTRLIRSFKMFLTFSACFLLVLAVALEDNSTKRSAGEQESEKYNVLILGAGMAGIMHLSSSCPRGVTPGEPREIPGNAKFTWNKV